MYNINCYLYLCRPRASSGQAVRGKTVTSAQSTTTTSVAVKAKTEKKTVSQPTKFNGSSKMNKGTARHTCSSGESGGREEDVDLQFRIEVDQTVQRLEREMDDDVTITSPYHVHGAGAGAVSAGLGNYGDDILPSAAENMGSGSNMYIHVHTHMHAHKCMHVPCLLHAYKMYMYMYSMSKTAVYHVFYMKMPIL